ncbi:MAG: PorV/PorQ family protein [Bacteroidia bacterium]|nr:PorV/PorQ family protein [Bacteroidia bacterium]
MNFRKIFFVFSAVAGLSITAQTVKYSNEFLAVGVGARALGMGNVGVASVNDVTSGYWNPAGLHGLKSNMEAGLMHAEYFAGIAKYDYGALAFRIDSLSVGSASFVRFGVDNIPNTTELRDANGNIDYDRITSFSATDFAAILSYARSIPKLKGIKIGGSAKIIRRRIGDFAGSWGFGLDVGANYNYKKWRFAAVGRDITGTFNAWTYNLSQSMVNTFALTGNEIPSNNVEITVPRLILGAAYTQNFWKDKIGLTAEINLINTFDGKRNVMIKSNAISTDPTIGLELSYLKMIFLRTGINNIQKITDITGKRITIIQPNFGVGIKYKVFSLDYALTNFGGNAVSTYSNIFSLKIEINRKNKHSTKSSI